jgi:1-acyl-sn-glycerol-3-phosphate acyltransferase
MIIKARHHWFYYSFFKLYSRCMPRKDFSKVTLHHQIQDRGLPILMLGNHTSWWDGFLALYVNLELFGRKFHVMMLEEELSKRMFLNKSGAYSIKKGNRSSLESLRYTADILGDNGNMAVLFPQGQIRSIMDYPVAFEAGWHRVIKYLDHPVQLIFYMTLTDFFSSRKPQVHIYLYETEYEGKSVKELETDFNRCLLSSIDHQKTLV